MSAEEKPNQRTRIRPMIGTCAAMRNVLDLIDRAADSDVTVLLEGETGTGKEATAESIHCKSRRRDGPFVVVDCSALARQLLASELFGHERGSFTGAVSARKGAFEAANGGTIFLDEIGEFDLDLQPNLLRALERREVKRIGSNRYNPVDVRVVAATNRNLRDEVAAGRFRSDLYYRLAVINIYLPPLRERHGDLPALVDDLLKSVCAQSGVPISELDSLRSEAYLAQLASFPWEGNIRELRNHLERCVALGKPLVPGGPQTLPSAPEILTSEEIDLDLPLKVAREVWVSEFERRYLGALLERYEGRVAAAARAAGVDRAYFYRLLWKHGLRERDTA